MDILLATAYQILEGEKCPQCGMYVWMCHTEDPDMQFEVEEDSCEATRMVANRSKQLEKRLADQPWIQLRPNPVMADKGRDFVSLRVPYFEEQALRSGAEPAVS